MRKMVRLDVDEARISRGSDGSVQFDDPGSPWVVKVWTDTRRRGRPTIARIEVIARDDHQVGITGTRLRGLPMSQMLHIAHARTLREHPNETYYRMLAVQKAVGQRSWGEEHWQRVLTVYEWAKATGRPGGGTQAIADMWGVAKKPTAERWQAKARERKAVT